MSGASARDGRRRRVLQEEVLSASREMPAYSGDEQPVESGEGRRYAISPDSLGHALARRHFPGHWIVPVGMMVAASALTAAVVALDLHAGKLAAQFGRQGLSIIELGTPGSLGNYLSSTAMLLSAVAGVLILAVRRQRVDDYRGKYRLWRSAIALFAVASLVVGTGLHHTFAETMTCFTGVQLFGGGAGWWVLTAGTIAAIVATRVVLDLRECRFAMFPFAAALGALAFSLVPVSGWPASGSTAESIMGGFAVWGYLMVPASLVAYMRFLRHDVAAGVATRLRVTRPHESAPVREATKARESASDTLQIARIDDSSEPSSRGSKPKKAKSQARLAEVSRWTDGSDGAGDDYDDDLVGQGRKFNKADRKRMRREKEERRAA